jgi:oligopeptidase B
MRRWSPIVALLVVLAACALGAPERAAAEPAALRLAPPIAARKPVRLTAHGIERVDDYAWLRDSNWRQVIQDPSRLAPDIRAHLDAENSYAEAVLAPLSGLRVKLVEEMKGRIEPDDSGVPLPDGPYAYWRKYVPGAEHPRIVRAPSRGGPEQVLLDGPALAASKSYFSFGEYHHSPDHRLYAYTVDETGSESYDLRIRDIGAGRDLPEVIPEVYTFTWARDGRTLFYVRLDDEHRARFVYHHRVGSDPSSDQLVYEEKDVGFGVSVDTTRSGRFVVISTEAPDTSEAWLIDAERPESAPRLVVAREPGLRYYLDDWGDRLVIRTNADGAEDFKLVTASAAAPGRENWRDLGPYKEGRQVLDVVALASHLVRLEREDGFERLVIRRKADGSEHTVAFGEEAYSLDLGGPYEFDSRTIRYLYSSPATPRQTFDYDLERRERVLRKQAGHPERPRPHRLCGAAAFGCDRGQRAGAGHGAASKGPAARRLGAAVPGRLWRLRLRVSDLVRCQRAVAGRPRFRLRDRPHPRRIGEGRALAQRRPPA